MKILLAPMDGVIDPVFRALYGEIGGFSQMATEFVRVSQHLLPSKIFLRTCPELKTAGRTKSGVPVFVQLLGSDPPLMAENALIALGLGAPGIDLNFGCPAKTVNRRDGGSVLLKDPKRVFAVVKAVREAVPQTVPVTAKVRLGYEHKNFVREIAQAAEAAGASHLTVHARTKVEGYKPPAHWECIAEMRAAVKSINVIANGDIWDIPAFLRCRDITGCTDFALGRAAVSNPFLALQIQQYELADDAHREQILANQDAQRDRDWRKVCLDLLPRFLQDCADFHSEHYGVTRGKQWLSQMRRHYPAAGNLFDQVKRSQSAPEFLAPFLQRKSEALPSQQSTAI